MCERMRSEEREKERKRMRERERLIIKPEERPASGAQKRKSAPFRPGEQLQQPVLALIGDEVGSNQASIMSQIT